MNRTGMPLCNSKLGERWIEYVETLADAPSRVSSGRNIFRIGSIKETRVLKLSCESFFGDSEIVMIELDEPNESEKRMLLTGLGKMIVGGEDNDIVFPSAEKFHFDCSCKDNVKVCMHSIASLISLTENNSKGLLSFLGFDYDVIENSAIQDSIDIMLSNVDNHSDRILDFDNVKKLFGI